MIKSAWRGVARKIIPNRSISYRLTAACIISTAQQASPNVKGQSEPALAHAKSDNIFEYSHSILIINLVVVLSRNSVNKRFITVIPEHP